MFTFLTGFLGGAAVSAGYVLLRTPRSGHENQRFVKSFYYETKGNVENVQDKASNLQAAINNVKVEMTKLQVGFIPEVKKIADDYQTELQVYTRRINDEMEQINNEVEVMTNRINVQNQDVQIDQSSSSDDDSSDN